jgi:hypothetical protein
MAKCMLRVQMIEHLSGYYLTLHGWRVDPKPDRVVEN